MFTNDRQKTTKVKWIFYKTVNIRGTYSSLEEAFEFCCSSFTDERKLTKIDQEKHKIEQICIWNPMTTGLSCVQPPPPLKKKLGRSLSLPDFFWGEGGVCTQATTGFIKLIYVISMEFLSLRRKRSFCIKAWLTKQTALQRNLYSLSKRRTLFSYLISLETRTRW